MTEQKETKVEDIKTAAEGKGCPVQKAYYYVTEFLAGPMCGRCFPCSMGCYEARLQLKRIIEGAGSEADAVGLKRIAVDMAESSMCKKGKDSAKFILEWMDRGVFAQHLAGRCASGDCTALVEYRILSEACIMCGACKNACKYTAILGEKKKPYLGGYLPFEIRQKRCTRCGECIKVCPTKAIVRSDMAAPAPVAA